MDNNLKLRIENVINNLPRVKLRNNIKKGVYFLFDGDELVYIGQSKDIQNRVQTHMDEGVKKFDSFSYIYLELPVDRDVIERGLINEYLPKYNNDSLTKKLKEEMRLFCLTFQHEVE